MPAVVAFAHASAGRGCLADVEQAAQEGAGAKDDRPGAIDVRRRRRGRRRCAAAAPALSTSEVLDGLLAESQARLLLAEAADFLLIGALVGLGPGAVHGRPLAAVEHAELDGGGVDGPAHECRPGRRSRGPVAPWPGRRWPDCSSSGRWCPGCWSAARSAPDSVPRPRPPPCPHGRRRPPGCRNRKDVPIWSMIKGRGARGQGKRARAEGGRGRAKKKAPALRAGGCVTSAVNGAGAAAQLAVRRRRIQAAAKAVNPPTTNRASVPGSGMAAAEKTLSANW